MHPMPSPNRIAAPVALAPMDSIGQQRIRHYSGSMPMRMPHSPTDVSENYIGATSIQQITADMTSLIYT